MVKQKYLRIVTRVVASQDNDEGSTDQSDLAHVILWWHVLFKPSHNAGGIIDGRR